MVRVRPSETSQTTQVSTQSVNQINSVNSQGINQYNTVQGVNDLSKYYTDLSRQWAISDTIVSNIDYSSKYYAQKAKEYKEIAEGTIDNIELAEQTVLADIQTAKTVAIADIDTETALKITEITNTASDFEDDLTVLTTRAETAAANAQGYMTSASGYANAANSSASEASTAKTQAQTAAYNAQGCANQAIQSASEANASETNARLSKESASISASTAQFSANAASTSETLADRYASIASEAAGHAEVAAQEVQHIKETIESELDDYVLKETEVNGKALNGNITLNASDVGALTNTTKYGNSIAYSLDSTTYILTLTLKDQDNNALNSINIDLPLESYILSVSYDNTTKELVISYQSGSTIKVPIGAIIGGLQTEITSTNMLSSDLVDDTNNTHKFATASQLQQITTNTTNIGTINTTIGGYGNIVTHNINEFATSAQGAKADTAIQSISINGTVLTPDINKKVAFTVPLDTGDLTNNAGYIKGITSADVITALGFTPYNSTNPNNYITSAALTPYALKTSLATVATTGSYNDLADKPYIPSGVIVDQTYDATSQNAQSGVAMAGALANYVTNSSLATTLTNYVTTNTVQTITANKIFDNADIETNSTITLDGSSAQIRATASNDTYRRIIGRANSGIIVIGNSSDTLSMSGYQLRLKYNNADVAMLTDVPDRTSDLINDSLADKDLSNLSTTGQAVIDGKVNKSGDTMTGGLQIDKSTTDDTGNYYINLNGIEYADTVSTSIYPHILTVTDANDDIIGDIEYVQHNNGNKWISLQAHNVTSNTYSALKVGFKANGDAFCEFPQTDCVDGVYNNTAGTIVTGVSLQGSTNLEYTLSDLPAENCLVWLGGSVTTGTTSGNMAVLQVVTSLQSNRVDLCRAVTRTNSSMIAGGFCIVPVSSNKKIYVVRDSTWRGTFNLYLRGYRRMGSNT